LHRKQTTNLKTEGDGKSPAGIFGIGTAFGRARVPPLGSLWNWLQVGENHFWVDDPASPQYNRLVELPVGQEPAKRWKSFERLKASYRYGVVVKHNLPHVVPGAGSAIFLHPWAAPTATTVGCTAMDERELIRIIRWLNPAQEPLLVQLPRAEFKRLAGLLP
jgi:L,D-peptidoglycan transpeptidase YkuD (ErfK/YbiS/YcfS/YnhG family)